MFTRGTRCLFGDCLIRAKSRPYFSLRLTDRPKRGVNGETWLRAAAVLRTSFVLSFY
jgi:hypothetical protein